ncbi:OmpA family protein [Pseudoflavitalea rhizosphaerae]|uniref:OmpA family protein n=1 Tax=Pseudoflavitalea rhizosphaerae TaxID=1884793 RepID=UPI001F49CAA6|nr:OmpA family protein [Pseudoflavitalea rhizosphaerae]
MANNYAFPAKPRNKWEIGVKGGLATISGDVRARPGWGAGLHVRKALGYVFSLRADFGYYQARGLNWQPGRVTVKNPAWAGYTPGSYVFYNYKSTMYDGSLQGVFTLNNIRFHKAKTGFNIYGFVGVGGLVYDVKVNAQNGSSGNYEADFNTYVAGRGLNNFKYKDRKDIRKDVKDMMDDSYETQAERDNGPELFDKPFKPTLVFGGGMQFRLSKTLSLSIEDKVTIAKTDLLDGQQYQENDFTHAALTPDKDLFNFASIGLNFNIGGKSVEPLWWLNPLDYAYNELNAPRHMKLPKPVLDDADGDGVTDQFDQEPNTPAGAPVDTRGVSRDTDGDGVPDYKDKELITPTQCQPVDADGVGKCPEPECCKELRDKLANYKPGGDCQIGDLPSISFRGKTVVLSKDAKALLASVAQKMRDHSDCKVAVVGYCSTNKTEQQLSWDRVNAVINHLVEKEGISADRFIFKYGEMNGDCNTVDLRDGTGEEGPTTVPAPHPNLRRRG